MDRLQHTHILAGDIELKDYLTWVKGTHSFAGGGDYLRLPVMLITVDHFGQVRDDYDLGRRS